MSNPKNKNFAFRISEQDLKEIKQKAKLANLTATEYLIKSALGKEIVVIDGLPQMIGQLKSIGNNLNQLTMLAQLRRIETVNLSETSHQLNQIYSQLRVLMEVM